MAATGAGKIFKGCAIGCGLIILIGFGSCVGFVMWVNQPGELIDTNLLCGSDSRGYAEWELSLEDPGTERMVMSILDSMARIRSSLKSDLPSALDVMLKNWQTRRDQKKVREIFPLVVAWSLRPGAEDDIHQVTLSIERLGNQMVLMDWVLGWALGRSDEVRVVRYGGEKIYRFHPSDVAFFMRRSDVIFSSDLESAQQLVDRLETGQAASPGRVHSLLAQLPQGRPLRVAITNENDELRRLMGALATLDEFAGLGQFEWSEASSLVVSGGFNDNNAFAAQLKVDRNQGQWTPEETLMFQDVFVEALGGEATGVVVQAWARGRSLDADITISDLPRKIEEAFGALDGVLTSPAEREVIQPEAFD